MELTPVDELPFHQTATPFNVAATSDVHFNDGYWFATYTRELMLVAGIRLHPNMNVVDGFAAIAIDGEQHAMRLARPLRPDYDSLGIGPLGIDFVDPMRRIKVVLQENEHPLSFDLEFTGDAQPFTETPTKLYKHGHLITDIIRYIQVNRVSGVVEVAGRRIQLESAYGCRDHSWGMRPSMGPPTQHGGIRSASDEGDRRALRIWVPFEVEGHQGFFHTHEDAQGNTLDVEGQLWFADGTAVRVVSVEHQLRHHRGSHAPAGGWFRLTDATGRVRHYDLEPVGTPLDVQGLGYFGGWRDRAPAGMYRGDDVRIEFDRYPSSGVGPRTGPPHLPPEARNGVNEYPSLLVCDGELRGMCQFEQSFLGPYPRYGVAKGVRS